MANSKYNVDLRDTDLSKIPQCIRTLCGIIASPGPPTCTERDDCPGRLWRRMREKEN
jgi:hypothetical protein